MAGIGLFIIAIAYGIFFWAVEAMQGAKQASFVTYIFPFAK